MRNRLVTVFLENAELRAKMRKELTLDYWRSIVDKLLADHDIPLLKNAGKISKIKADAIADKEYAAFDAQRKYFEALQADKDDLIELESSVADIKQLK